MKIKLKWVNQETYTANAYHVHSHYSLYTSIYMQQEDVDFCILEDDLVYNCYGVVRKDGNKIQDPDSGWDIDGFRVVYISKELFDEITNVAIQINNELNQEI